MLKTFLSLLLSTEMPSHSRNASFNTFASIKEFRIKVEHLQNYIVLLDSFFSSLYLYMELVHLNKKDHPPKSQAEILRRIQKITLFE